MSERVPILRSEISKELGFSFHPQLYNNLALWRNAVLNQDIDFVAVVDGKEGGGKTTVCQQLAYMMDVDREVLPEQIVWTADALEAQMMKSKKGKAIIYDEAGRTFDRRSYNSKEMLRVRKLLWECRRRNLFLFFIIPSIYDLDMMVAVHRTRMLAHIWYDWDLKGADFKNHKIPEKPLVRGYGTFYTEDGKKSLYCNEYNRKNYIYKIVPNNSFHFWWPEHYVINKETYKELRDRAEADFFISEGQKLASKRGPGRPPKKKTEEVN